MCYLSSCRQEVSMTWTPSASIACLTNEHRRRTYGQEIRIGSEEWSTHHHWWTVRPGRLLRFLPDSCHRLPPPCQQETHFPFRVTRNPMEEASSHPLSGQCLDSGPIAPQTRGVRRGYHWICFVPRILSLHLRLSPDVVRDDIVQPRAPK